jgi:hypothetical protein
MQQARCYPQPLGPHARIRHPVPPTPPILVAMLDYIKLILLKVSFSKSLFEKELRKALRNIQPDEFAELKTWCYAQFGRIYRRVLKLVFARFSRLPRLAAG